MSSSCRGPDVEGAELAAVIYGDKYSTIKQYVDILTSTGITWGLLGPREADRVWERHVLNCVALESVVPVGASLVDVGSGAGLPGLPIAIARPDLEVTLLEPLLRRYTFLTETVEALGLGDRVRVERGRAEDCDETFDVVTARAVAPLDRLLGWCTPPFLPCRSVGGPEGVVGRAGDPGRASQAHREPPRGGGAGRAGARPGRADVRDRGATRRLSRWWASSLRVAVWSDRLGDNHARERRVDWMDAGILDEGWTP